MTRTITGQFIISCPVCGSDGPELRHDVRSSLLYFCVTCDHEWQMDPEDEPLPAVPTPSSKPSRDS